MTARYFGGPLADHDAKPVRGRWPVFRDEHGEPIPTARGDAELADRTRPHRLYVHDEDTDTYVWAADWRRWRTRPRTAGDAA